MRSRSVPHSDPCNHSRSVSKHMCPGPLLQTLHPSQLKSTTLAAWHKGRKRCPLSLSSDWFSSLRSIKDYITKENPTAVKAAWSHRPWIIRNLWWSMSYCEYHLISTILLCSFTILTSPGRGIEKETTAPPDLLHYLCISLAVNMLRHCSFLTDELFFSYWWKTAAPGHTFNCLPHQKFISCTIWEKR